jgi:DNA-binding response OmpR family regulator
MTGGHVLVVDDDPSIRDLVRDYLAGYAFAVSTAADGAATARLLAAKPVDLMVLDLHLAHEDGIDVMRDVVTRSEAPIIIVTGQRRDEPDRILGLELGADDYLTKPFSPRELLARIRAVLRRAEMSARSSRRKEQRLRYRFAGWELHLRTRQLVAPSQEEVKLTAAEFNLLTAFLRSPQQILSREQLLAASRVHDEEVFDRSVDVLILRLRRKLEANPSQPQIIRTERGAGYLLAVPVEVL